MSGGEPVGDHCILSVVRAITTSLPASSGSSRGRPVVAREGSPTPRVSSYIDLIRWLLPLVKQTESALRRFGLRASSTGRAFEERAGALLFPALSLPCPGV